jgi:hypothetical protein
MIFLGREAFSSRVLHGTGMKFFDGCLLSPKRAFFVCNNRAAPGGGSLVWFLLHKNFKEFNKVSILLQLFLNSIKPHWEKARGPFCLARPARAGTAQRSVLPQR